jgi:DNA replication licensing factor MCM6
MVQQDHILMAVEGQTLPDAGEGEAGEGPSNAPAQEVVYVLHPNCAVEDV